MKFEKAIKQGAYINYVSTPDDFVSGNKETTPLIESSFRNSDEIFDYLVQRQDILIDAQNRNGSNAVMLAAMAGRKDRVEKLIARNASLLNRDGDGCDVVDHARAGQHDSLIPWLVQQMNVQRAKSNPRLPPPQP
jgi:ankyrin repeat protein